MGKPRIIMCVPVYNEERLLKDCLRSLTERADAILIIDGAYKGFDGENTHSTDGTKAIIKRFMETMPIKYMAARRWKSSIDKFQRFFEMFDWHDGDWMFLMDADDRIDATDEEWREFLMILELIPEMYPNVYVGTIRYIGFSENVDYVMNTRKLIRWFEGVRYGWNHSTFTDGKGNVIDEGNHKIVRIPLRVRRMEHLRSPRRIAAKQRYNEMIRDNVEWVDKPENWEKIKT